jgi:NAD(P)-dependent dehydrogenase (short-subunit alcohol dehydrogenase family)
MNTMSSPVWLITGASNGFGLLLCLRALQANHQVVGTVRSRTKSADAVKQIEDTGGRVIYMDMTESKESITKKIQAVGRIDYLINNAGYSLLGACEYYTQVTPCNESHFPAAVGPCMKSLADRVSSAEEVQLQMQTNFFGPLFATQAALPGMRERRTGTIVNLSSIAAQDPLAACALYAASKGALEAASASLAVELAPFGVSMLIVEPGAFRTNFLSATMPAAAACPEAYRGTPVHGVIDKFGTMAGQQAGDPVKGVERIFEAVTGEGMAGHLKGKVLRLVIGEDALTRIRNRNAKFLEELSLGEEATLSTGY